MTNVIIGDNAAALDGAERAARALGYSVDRWRELRGEANDLGRTLAGHLCALREPRLCVLAGGEPVVTVAGAGKGGRAQQCALALALELARIGGDRKIAALFAGTDGIDGPDRRGRRVRGSRHGCARGRPGCRSRAGAQAQRFV